MRKLAAVAGALTFVAAVATAQMKVPPQPRVTATPQQTTTAPNPIAVQMNQTPAPTAQPPLESAKRIARDEAIKLVKEGKAIWVDVRNKESYDAGHIKGAVSIPLGELPSRIKELPKNKEIITYCAWVEEHTSARAVLDLNAIGIKNTAALLGGWNGWVAAKEPIETTPVKK